MKTLEKTNKRTAIIYWGITLSYMVIIFYFSSLESYRLPFSAQDFDKVLHACIYTILAFLSYFSLRKSGVYRYVFLVSFLFATLYGISDELHQFYVPNRNPSIGDIIADSFGAFLGSYLASVTSTRKI